MRYLLTALLLLSVCPLPVEAGETLMRPLPAKILDVRTGHCIWQDGGDTNYTGPVYQDSVLVEYRPRRVRRPFRVWKIYTSGDFGHGIRRPKVGDRLYVYYHPHKHFIFMGGLDVVPEEKK